MLASPRIRINNHKHVDRKWRCFWGRYNGYADDIKMAYEACIRCAFCSKYLMSDIKKYPQLKK